jgi:hypothetical protein
MHHSSISISPFYRFAVLGEEKDWENVKLNNGSNVVSISSADSTKKKKRKAVASELAAEFNGKNGVYDPKGMLKKGTKKKPKL